MAKQPWLHSPTIDVLLICGPAFLSVAFAWLMHDELSTFHEIPIWWWVTLVLACDVAHVYATLFRTYLHSTQSQIHRGLLISAPFAALAIGILLYSISDFLFWRTLAYIAVFHFMRQQYGFVRLYSRQDSHMQRRWHQLDTVTIYLATLYPIVYWHTHLPREFHWFINNDFIPNMPLWLDMLLWPIYSGVMVAFIVKECWLLCRGEKPNIPRLLIIGGTVLSWYTGIVLFNGDLIFTLINVVSHGLPYMALVWIYGRRDFQQAPQRFRIFTLPALPLYVAALLAFAYIEEWCWHGLIWREYLDFFAAASLMPFISSHAALSILVPLLSLPQTTHYILDGFIWKRISLPANT